MDSLTALPPPPPPPPCANCGARETILGTLLDSETKFRSTFKAISPQECGAPIYSRKGTEFLPFTTRRLKHLPRQQSFALVSKVFKVHDLELDGHPSTVGLDRASPLRGLINGGAVAEHVFCAAAAYLFPPLSVSRDCTKTHFERNAHLSRSLLSSGNQTFSFLLSLSPSRLISQDLLFSFLAFPPSISAWPIHPWSY